MKRLICATDSLPIRGVKKPYASLWLKLNNWLEISLSKFFVAYSLKQLKLTKRKGQIEVKSQNTCSNNINMKPE